MIDISGNPETHAFGQKVGAPGQSAPENTSPLSPFGSVLDGLMEDHLASRSAPHMAGRLPLSASISGAEALANDIVSVLDAQTLDHSEQQSIRPSPVGSVLPDAWQPEVDPALAEMDTASEQLEGMPHLADMIETDGVQTGLADAGAVAMQETASGPQRAKPARSAALDDASDPQSTVATPADPLKPHARPALSAHEATDGEKTALIGTISKKPVLSVHPAVVKPQSTQTQPSASVATQMFGPAPSAAQVDPPQGVQHAAQLTGHTPGSIQAGIDNLQTNALGIAAPTTPQQGTAGAGQIVQNPKSAIPMHGPNWVTPMISGPVVSLLDAAGGRMVIDIAPEELGRLTISLTVQGDTAIVRFQTDTAEAARILADAERHLSSELARFGMTLAGHDATADRKQSGGRAAHPSDQPGLSDDLSGPSANPAVATALVNIIA